MLSNFLFLFLRNKLTFGFLFLFLFGSGAVKTNPEGKPKESGVRRSFEVNVDKLLKGIGNLGMLGKFLLFSERIGMLSEISFIF